MRIAIIGAGPAAVGLLDALARSGEGHDITVFDPSPHPWRGRPYAADLDSVLVNVPPMLMSVRHDDREHYATWLGERGARFFDPLMGAPLVPRAMYGEYLEETAGKAMAGGNVRLVPERVVGTTRDLRVRTEGGREYQADRVVLCVGSGTPGDPYGLDGAPGYIGDPYPLARTLEGVGADASVVIIGSRLTAVDVAVSLGARGHAGPISLVSRGGMLPHVWQRPGGYQPKYLNADAVRVMGADVTLAKLHDLFRAELEEIGEDIGEIEADLRAALTDDPGLRLRRQVDLVDTPLQARRLLQQACHNVMPHAWPLLPESDRATLRRHSRLAVSLASPMVPVNGVRMAELFESGQLDSVGGVKEIVAAPSGFDVRCEGGTRHAEVVVNAVNPPPGSVPKAAVGLVEALLGAGLAATHPDGGIVPSDPRVHVVGDLHGGRPFLTSGIPEVVNTAANAARALTQG
ncbi:FAD/NAD(P)-binding protein [Actinomadura rupiterrae]|uniref:FAD/NAD(P)-binding protein n=1 Tax=Actinomadura rupiterrae TaxID=559627 RepID=UPI0020A5E155|nr:FAD/NAD(P)-binding protein [Actinomadura rupiterrae]MCP2339469.1 putative NAD(P)/FAD-binding protein YdhS [Actinomadura rupiterrae]